MGQLARQCIELCRAWANREIDGNELAEQALKIGVGNGVDFSHVSVREHDRQKYRVKRAGQVEFAETKCS
jgi:hypothetical protein